MKNTIPQIFLEYSHKLIGIPYEDMDCYELVKYFYMLIFKKGFNAYDYNDPLNKSETSDVIRTARNDYQLVKDPQFGDVILIREHGLPTHLGVYINDVYFLHTTKTTGSILDRNENISRKIEGYFR